MNLLNRGFPRHVRELIIARADGAVEVDPCGSGGWVHLTNDGKYAPAKVGGVA